MGFYVKYHLNVERKSTQELTLKFDRLA